MLKRMVIGLPRSGTTWAANWLTYGGEVCVHDPLWFKHYSDWDKPDGFEAVSCTGIWDWPEFVMAQTCPIVVLHRVQNDVLRSLQGFSGQDGSSWITPDAPAKLRAINAPNISHHHWCDLFNPVAAAQIWRHLDMPGAMPYGRHAALREMNIQPENVIPDGADMDLHARLLDELRAKRARATVGTGD